MSYLGGSERIEKPRIYLTPAFIHAGHGYHQTVEAAYGAVAGVEDNYCRRLNGRYCCGANTNGFYRQHNHNTYRRISDILVVTRHMPLFPWKRQTGLVPSAMTVLG